MTKYPITTTKPVFIMLYGYPGAGKTHVAKQLADTIAAAHLSSDRLRGELFNEPRFDQEEDRVVDHLMVYMAEEFMRAGLSVIFDTNTDRLAVRRELRNLAHKSKAQPLLVWLQIDVDSAFARLGKRDRRRTEDKYARNYDRAGFDSAIGYMQNPHDEDFMVISGKHTFNTQRSAIIKKLYELGIINTAATTANVVKPGMVNLVPTPMAGRVDQSRRNIMIR